MRPDVHRHSWNVQVHYSTVYTLASSPLCPSFEVDLAAAFSRSSSARAPRSLHNQSDAVNAGIFS
eukprot:500357-Prorocentrum_minimum.AAC.7